MTIQLVGMTDFRKKMAQGNLAVIEGAKAAVTELVIDIGKESQDLVPVDTGNLKRSIVLKFPLIKSNKPVGEIAYGGTAAPYAVVQHEDTSLSHPPKAKGGSPVVAGTGRGPKYLEFPVKRKAANLFNKILVSKINAHLRKYGS
jgi:hypothetical protein